ncbi:MAG: hypothetical protein ACM3SY_05415 [Candidatus Omnitrophota bacterium]
MPTMDEKNHSPDQFISANHAIDVDEIMTAIRKRIQEKKNSGLLTQSQIDDICGIELLPIPDFSDVPNIFKPHLYPQSPTPEEPFQPLAITLENEKGAGIKGLMKNLLGKWRKIVFPLIRFMTRPIYNELKQFTADRYNDNAQKLFELHAYQRTTNQSKEYIKLLHNAINNLITEITRLKIDHDLLTSKVKVMEDQIEFLENRERAIEKKVFESDQ